MRQGRFHRPSGAHLHSPLPEAVPSADRHQRRVKPLESMARFEGRSSSRAAHSRARWHQRLHQQIRDRSPSLSLPQRSHGALIAQRPWASHIGRGDALLPATRYLLAGGSPASPRMSRGTRTYCMTRGCLVDQPDDAGQVCVRLQRLLVGRTAWKSSGSSSPFVRYVDRVAPSLDLGDLFLQFCPRLSHDGCVRESGTLGTDALNDLGEQMEQVVGVQTVSATRLDSRTGCCRLDRRVLNSISWPSRAC